MSPADGTGVFDMHGFLKGWQAMSAAALASAKATNRTLLAPFEAAATVAHTSNGVDGPTRPASIPALLYERDDWIFERSVDQVEDITVGDSVRFTKRITQDDVDSFAVASGDTNRLHLDEAYAEKTRFGTRIVHGTLVSGLISAALARLPGLTIYLSQDVEFLRPIMPDTEVTAYVEIIEDLGDGQYRLMTDIEDLDGKKIVDGEAVVLIDSVES